MDDERKFWIEVAMWSGWLLVIVFAVWTVMGVLGYPQ